MYIKINIAKCTIKVVKNGKIAKSYRAIVFISEYDCYFYNNCCALVKFISFHNNYNKDNTVYK